ncbi:MAG: hypothetical protein ACKPKO_16825 [Candidatus Fonsibacter sp.]
MKVIELVLLMTYPMHVYIYIYKDIVIVRSITVYTFIYLSAGVVSKHPNQLFFFLPSPPLFTMRGTSLIVIIALTVGALSMDSASSSGWSQQWSGHQWQSGQGGWYSGWDDHWRSTGL